MFFPPSLFQLSIRQLCIWGIYGVKRRCEQPEPEPKPKPRWLEREREWERRERERATGTTESNKQIIQLKDWLKNVKKGRCWQLVHRRCWQLVHIVVQCSQHKHGWGCSIRRHRRIVRCKRRYRLRSMPTSWCGETMGLRWCYRRSSRLSVCALRVPKVRIWYRKGQL